MSSRIPKTIADLELQIATAIGVGDTSFTLNNNRDDDGEEIPAGIYCFTVDNGTSNKEYLIGQVNGTAVTSVKSVSRQGVETVGATKKHRIGAPAILTDFAAIQRVVDILKGINTLDGANPIKYDTEPTLSDREEVATVGYVLDAAFGGSITFDSQVITGVNAGESVVLGDLVYLNTTDQEWYKVDADTSATVVGVQLGITKGTGSDGVAIAGGVQLSGVFTTSGLTAGSLYYASNTAGGYTTSAGTIKQVVGVALSTTRLLLTLPNPQTVSSREKDALAGGGAFGTPSSTNKFLTEGLLENGDIKIIPVSNSGSSTKNINDATGTQVIAHGLGVAPTFVSIKAFRTVSGTTSVSIGEWYAGNGYSTICWHAIEGGSSATADIVTLHTDKVAVLREFTNPTVRYQDATITVDATNITINWVKEGAAASETYDFIWLAKAETLSYS